MSTVTLPFDNLTLAEGDYAPNVLAGGVNATLFYVSDWTLILNPFAPGQLTVNPTSGHTSGSVNVAVSGAYDGDHVIFWFNLLESPVYHNVEANLTDTFPLAIRGLS